MSCVKVLKAILRSNWCRQAKKLSAAELILKLLVSTSVGECIFRDLRSEFFFSILVFFHEHSQFTGQQGKGEGIYFTPLNHFHSLHRHVDMIQAITAESSSLHIASSRARSGNLWFPSASC